MNLKYFIGISPQTKNYTISSKNLPKSFDGFTIAHISDAHSRPAKGVFKLIENATPNAICITGDMLQDDYNSTEDFDELLTSCLELAPVYMVTGNHDLWRHGGRKKLNEFTKKGAILLESTARKIEKDNEFINILGIGDPFSKLPDIIRKNVKTSIDNLPQVDGFKILLFHRANLFDLVKDCDADLVLSGHMHGGQIRLPKIGGILSPTSSILSERMIFPKYSGGEYESEQTKLIVNCGISNTTFLPRLGNPPEVGIITLKKLPLD